MSYIDKNLLPDEVILFRTKKHFIIFTIPAIYLLFALFFASNWGLAHTYQQLFQNDGLAGEVMRRFPLAIFTLAAIITGTRQWLAYMTSDYVVTNFRIVMKHGFFDRYVTDTRLTTISHVSVEQPLLGQVLNYGSLIINNFGGARDAFIEVAYPNLFQKTVQGQLVQMPGGIRKS